MNSNKDKSGLVDLFTFDASLEQELISDFLGDKFKEYVDKTGMDGKALYCFYDLDPSKLKDFLAGKKYEYEIRGSKNGEFLKVTRLPRGDIPSRN
jgi:hypothetical protein|tara:strand:- start:626 stop:910 length:285 start_codon:yes stop_codon:yes gene_type:complete